MTISLSRLPARCRRSGEPNRPVSCNLITGESYSHAAAGGEERLPQRRSQVAPLVVGKKAAEFELCAARDHAQRRAPVRPFAQADARPIGVAVEPLPAPGGVDPRQHKLGRVELQGLVAASGAVVEPEGDIDQEHVETEEAEHRPGAHGEKDHAGEETDRPERQHQGEKPLGTQRAVGREHRPEGVGAVLRLLGISGHVAILPINDGAREGSMPKTVRPGENPPRALAPKRAKRRAPRPSRQTIEEIFRRFAAASPEPKGELEYVNPFTLLVAVVLSAQATDVGVNKATRSLFKVASTPRQMLALGEEGLQERI